MTASLAQIEQQPCPGYRDPFTDKLHTSPGLTHSMVTRRGVRCATCGVAEVHLRAQVTS